MTSSHVAIILTHGFALVAGLIIAIGPQNLFLLRQGVQRRHLFLVATTCTLCDLLLLTLGLGGLHRFLLAYPALFRWVSWAGIFFLVYSGARAFHAAFTPAVYKAQTQGSPILSKASCWYMTYRSVCSDVSSIHRKRSLANVGINQVD